jgi:hypothetical protein
MSLSRHDEQVLREAEQICMSILSRLSLTNEDGRYRRFAALEQDLKLKDEQLARAKGERDDYYNRWEATKKQRDETECARKALESRVQTLTVALEQIRNTCESHPVYRDSPILLGFLALTKRALGEPQPNPALEKQVEILDRQLKEARRMLDTIALIAETGVTLIKDGP